MGQRRPDGLVPVLGTVPVSGILSEGLYKCTVYKYGLWTVTFMRYTRNTSRYISNAGGRDGIFVLGHTAIFKPTISLEPASQPAKFGSDTFPSK
jgi:hypothetical protein